MKKLIYLLALWAPATYAQCNQHVFTSVGATQYTQYQYQDCEGLLHWFDLPIGGYTIILCADIGTAFVLNGNGFVYASCIQIECPTDIDQNGTTDLNDLLLILQNYGTQCEN